MDEHTPFYMNLPASPEAALSGESPASSVPGRGREPRAAGGAMEHG